MRTAVLSRAWLGSMDLPNLCGSEAESWIGLGPRLRLNEANLGKEMYQIF